MTSLKHCRVCRNETKPSLKLDGMPRQAQYLPDAPDEGITLNIVQCVGCGLVQLANESVPYWREEITFADLSEKMRTFRNEQFQQFREIHGRNPDFTSFNRLEHMPDPMLYLSELDGIGIVEVPNFDMALKNNRAYEFIIDHLSYFTNNTLQIALVLAGFDIYSCKKIWGDYILSATVGRRAQLDLTPMLKANGKLAREIIDFVDDKPYAIYGAGHEALTLMAQLRLNPLYVCDDTIVKQGRYTPATGIPIVPAGNLDTDPVESVIIMCGSFSEEVARRCTHPKKAVLKDNKLELV